MSETFSTKYLGEEKISKLLLRFSIPCVFGLLISALYSIVDQIFIGNSELGYLGNAATGVSFPVICIANAFAWCIGDGAAAFLSICSGQGDQERAHKCVGTGITVTVMISIVLGSICLIFAEPLMRMFGASEQTLGMAVTYFRITAALFPCYLLMNVMNGMIRADGSPGYAMIAMLTGAVINIVLDPVFIYGFKWGISGVAWASAIGQAASCLLCVNYFRKPRCFVLTRRSFIPDRSVLASVAKLGASTFVTQIAIVVMALVCNMTLARYGALSEYGQDIPISVFSIQTKVFTIVGNIVVGIVLGGQPIFGYNYGARKYDRVRETYRIILIASLIASLAATLIFQLCPQIVVNLFGVADGLYMEFAVRTFRIYLSLITVSCLTKMTSIFFQSIGKAFHATITSLSRDLLLFTPLALILSAVLEKRGAGMGVNGVLYAAPIADAVTAVILLWLTVPFFRTLGKEEKAGQ